MHHTLGNGEALPGTKQNGPPVKIDLKATIHDIEELVLVVVLVPVKLTLHDAESYYAIVYAAKSLVVPGILARVDERLHIDELERRVPNVEVNGV